MSDYFGGWSLSRQRFRDAIEDLNQDQLNWRLHPESLTLGQMALHVAGVEISFASQLTGTQLDVAGQRLKAAATEGVVNGNPFPFSESETTPELVKHSLEAAERMVRPLMQSPSDEIRNREIVSALGPVITGDGALARLSFHAAYHQGQAHLVRTAPGFPK